MVREGGQDKGWSEVESSVLQPRTGRLLLRRATIDFNRRASKLLLGKLRWW